MQPRHLWLLPVAPAIFIEVVAVMLLALTLPVATMFPAKTCGQKCRGSADVPLRLMILPAAFKSSACDVA
jgi:hypothetical protein